MAEGNVGLPEAAAEPLVGRLSGAAGLVLPGHLQPRGDCAKGAASPERAAAYLRALLLRDAGVFLERHGRLLAREELELFQPLCASSYEVNFYYRQAAPSLPTTDGTLQGPCSGCKACGNVQVKEPLGMAQRPPLTS